MKIWSPADESELLALRATGASFHEIARLMGLTYQQVYNKHNKRRLRPYIHPGLGFGEALREQRLEAEACRGKLRDGSANDL